MKKIFILASIFLITNIMIFAQEEWTMIHPYPTLDDLLDTHFISENEGWAVGKNGLIMYTNNGGISWDIQHKDSDKMFWSIFFIDENEGWAVGWSDIYHTTDKGENWEKQNRPFVIGDMLDVYFINPDTGWIVGTYNIILKTVDGGEHWTRIMNHYNSSLSAFMSVCFVDEMKGYVVGGETFFQGGIILITNDGGLTWTDSSPPDCDGFQRVLVIDSLEAWVCGFGSELHKTDDGGQTWTNMNNSYYNSISDIFFFNDNNGILLSGTSVRLTFDKGETWDSLVYLPSGSSQNRLTSWAENEIITVGNNGSIIKSLDGGTNWSKINNGLDRSINQIGFLNSYDGYAIAGFTGYTDLYVTDDGGYNWSLDTVIQNGPFYRMFIKEESVYLLNNSSQMMKSVNSGDDWELFEIPDTTDYYYNMQFIDNDVGYLCGNNGILVKTIDGGNTWVDKSLSGDYNLRQMFFINDNKGWLIDPVARIVLKTINGGDDWSFVVLGDDYTFQPQSIFFINEEEGFVTTKEGVIFKSINGGEDWEEFYVFSSGTNSKMYFINENEGWYKSSTVIYHTYDGGLSWTSPQNFSYKPLTNMYFLDNQGWLCGYYGLVAETSFYVDIDENGTNEDNGITIQPNPARNKTEVVLTNKFEEAQTIDIYEITGKCVYSSGRLDHDNRLTIDITNLKPGTYIIHVETLIAKYTSKFVVM